jgi:hypothetical protein
MMVGSLPSQSEDLMDRQRRLLPYSLGLSLCAVLSLGGSCDRTRIEGVIEPSSVRTQVGSSVRLELVVAPAVADRTRRESWVVEPESLGKVTALPGSPRRATFHAAAPGRGKVTAFAYYRPQTSPQAVATIDVVVEAAAGAALAKPGTPFCDRFSKALVGCWCSGEQPRILETGSAVPNEAAALALVQAHFDAIVKARAAEEAPGARLDRAKLRCSEIAAGFFNCFAGAEYAATVSERGEIYQTECGV